MADSRIIFEATVACHHGFTDCLSVEALMTDEWAENRLADFNLWVSGTGASARGRASLDSRLASKPESREVIANLLRLLAGVVNECKEHATSATANLLPESNYDDETYGAALSPEEPPARSFSPWSDDSASDTQSETNHKSFSSGNPLQENMTNIEMLLDQLARIAIVVRRSGRRSRLQKADGRFKTEEYKDLEEHLITILLAHPEFSKEQIHRSKLSKVQKHLIDCNLKRRNRFLYAQRHSKWLDVDTKGLPSQVRAVENIGTHGPIQGEAVTEKQKSLSRIARPFSETAEAPMNPTVRTGTSASAVSDSLALPPAPIIAPAASTVMSSTVIELNYPRPPKVREGARVFMCPCCCQTFPVDLLQENRWKKHVAEDLSPYTCVLPECVKPDVLFTTKESWRQHLLEEHRSFEYWVCFACGDGTQFPSENDFAEHTKTKHAASVPLDRFSLLTSICRRSAPTKLEVCPLCNWPEGDKVEIDKDVLLEHIAKEIHSFSLRALPWADDNGQEADERINHSADKVYDWLVKYELSQNPDKERPIRKENIYASGHFQRNPYFGGSSVASSASESQSTASWEAELKDWKQREGSVTFNGSESDEIFRIEYESGETPYGISGMEPSTDLPKASFRGDHQVVERLLDHGVDVNAPSEEYGTALQAASQGGHLHVVQMLLDHGAEVNTQSEYYFTTALYAASEGGHLQVVERLLAYGANVNADNGLSLNALQVASQGGHLRVVELLLEHGADVNAQGGDLATALEAASGGGHLQVVELLLEHGADINADGRPNSNALQAASQGGHLRVVELLLEHGADVDADGRDLATALQAASGAGQLQVVELLLKHGADVNAQIKGLSTALQIASRRGFGEVVQMLIYHGADINAQDDHYWPGSHSINQADLEEEETIYRRMLSDYEKTHAPMYIPTLDIVRRLGFLYTYQRKLDEAEHMYRRALSGYEDAIGPEHTLTLDTINSLGDLYINQGKLVEAEEMYQRVLHGKEKNLGSEHSSTLDTLNSLGDLYSNQGKLAEAEEMYQRVLRGREKALDLESTIHTVNNLGNLYARQGKTAEAVHMFQRALDISLEFNSPDNSANSSEPGQARRRLKAETILMRGKSEAIFDHQPQLTAET